MSKNTVYNLVAAKISDCYGNFNLSLNSQVIVPDQANVGDVVINEVLFNPIADGSDFLELFNISDKYFNLNGWEISNAQSGISTVSDNYILEPDQYLVLTSDPDNIMANYLTAGDSNMLFIDLPSMPNDNGSAALTSSSGTLLDSIYYNADYHHPLLKTEEGVSLERLSSALPSEPINWHSASEDSGYGTPGAPNSQSIEDLSSSKQFTVSRIFSPNNDGHDDLCIIQYKMDNPGNILNAWVFDISGREIKELANNLSISTHGILTWDGTNQNSQLAGLGHYVIVLQLFSLSGNVHEFKELTVLAKRMN